MQTFLPYKSFEEIASSLDHKRLGKQRVEALQILKILADPDYKGHWKLNPAVLMWKGYEPALMEYGAALCKFWKGLGYKDNCGKEIKKMMKALPKSKQKVIYPPWLGDEMLHLSHRSNLLRKAPEHYRKQWPTDPDNLPYKWPINSPK